MGIDISLLSDKVQKQILQKIQAEQKPKAKYNNEKTKINKLTFDSKKEAERYTELMLLLEQGIISDLRLQETFTLKRAYTTHTGERVRALTYKADFTYTENGKRVVEDVKGVKTDVYKIKKKLMLSELGIEIKEI